MRIGIDVDGVLADTIVAIQRKFNGWDTTKGWYGGFTKEEFDKVWADARHTDKFWENIPVVQGFNHRAMIDLNEKHDLYFITDRFDTVGGSAVRQTLNWVRFQLLAGATPAGIVVAKFKGPVAKVLDLDAFIDDKPENCTDVVAAVPTCSVTLCSLPHNLKWESPANITRRESFNAFAMHILSEE
jgi:5'(3')-deoxyribonucleotidase